MRFLGIDLAWRSQPSGVCCLEWQTASLELLDLDRWDSATQVLQWVDRMAPPLTSAGIAIDAPTIITNLTGMRLCDRQCHQYFGKYDAGCYPANLSSPFAQQTLSFATALQNRGFQHGATINSQSLGRWQIEVFPHPATINLFGLTKILKYKKGKLGDRQRQLRQLCDLVLRHLPIANLEVLHLMLQELTNSQLSGKALKKHEDKLDSVICAYTAFHWWYWGKAQNHVLGDADTGFIVVPTTAP